MTVQQDAPGDSDTQDLEVWIDQDLCTGDGICVQYAPEVFELDIDGLAYVKSDEDELLQDKGATTPVPLPLLQDVVDSAKECPGDCIHVRRVSDNVEVFGPGRGVDGSDALARWSPSGPADLMNALPFHCQEALSSSSGQQRGTSAEE